MLIIINTIAIPRAFSPITDGLGMKFKALVYVTLKAGYSDPEGETTAHALRGLGYSVNDVRSSKAYELTIDAADQAKSEKLRDEMWRRLLTNPTKDNYRFEISELK